MIILIDIPDSENYTHLTSSCPLAHKARENYTSPHYWTLINLKMYIYLKDYKINCKTKKFIKTCPLSIIFWSIYLQWYQFSVPVTKLQMRGPAGLWLVAWLTAAVLSSALGQTCQRSTLSWLTADGTDPLKMARGNVTVVALLLASWPMCQQQAEE